VYKFADNILRTYDQMMSELAEAEKGSIVIKIEACRSIASYALPCTLIKANGAYPNHRYELSGNTSQEIITNVANNICDIGFTCVPGINNDRDDIVITKVGVSKMVLVSKNAESFPDFISIEDLLNACLITFTGNNDMSSFLERNLKQLGYTPKSLNCNLRVEGIESAKMLVLKSYGFAFLPYYSVKEELYKKQFKMIAVPDFNMEVDIAMLYKKDHSTRVKDFVEWFTKHGSKSFC
jgi:DNA-binding transcriptional LysR family regulator